MSDNYRLIPMWAWVVLILIFLFVVGSKAMAQQARPTYNPFNNNGMGSMMSYYGPNQQRTQYGFNNNQQFYGYRPNNNFNNNQQFYGQRPNNGFNNNSNNNFNNGFNNSFNNNNNFNNNNGFNNNQQQGNNQTNTPQLFTRRFHLNNGYLYGRPTLYFDPKSNKMQPWVRKNLR